MKKHEKKRTARKGLATLPKAAARRGRSPKAETSDEQKASQPKTATAPEQPDDSGEIVVFAIRLKRTERDLIHTATGSGKASEFVRGLALAAARGDMKAVEEIIDGVKR
jgi:hypothetical protein